MPEPVIIDLSIPTEAGGGGYSRLACLTVAVKSLTARPRGGGALFLQDRLPMANRRDRGAGGGVYS